MSALRALIVEDNPDITVVLTRALRDSGFESEVIDSGDAALTWLSSNVPDLVVLDLNLPGVTGQEILKHIRADPRLAKVQVIVATAYPRAAGEVRDEADWVFMKPFAINELRDLAKYLSSARSADQKAHQRAEE
jgi:DNA-binding response OmpR family regulator